MQRIATREDILKWADEIRAGGGKKYIPLSKEDQFALANFIATVRGNPSALALGGNATRAIDRRHEDMVQYAQQEAVEGTPQGENGLKNAAPNDTRFRPQGLERQVSSECQSWVGQPTCKPTGFCRGYLTVESCVTECCEGGKGKDRVTAEGMAANIPEDKPSDERMTDENTVSAEDEPKTAKATMTRGYALHRAGFTTQQAYDKFLEWAKDHKGESSVMDFSTGQKSVSAAFAYWLAEIIEVDVPAVERAVG